MRHITPDQSPSTTFGPSRNAIFEDVAMSFFTLVAVTTAAALYLTSEHEIVEIRDFGKMSGSHFPISCKQWVLKMPSPGFSNSRKNIGFEKSQIWEQLSDFKSQLLAALIFFDTNGKMDLEMLV